MTKTAFLALAGLWLTCAAPAAAQSLVPAEIPSTLPEAQQADFRGKRAGLDLRRGLLGAAVASQNARCRGIAEDSPRVPECRAAQMELNASVASYGDAVADYNRDLEQAAAAAR